MSAPTLPAAPTRRRWMAVVAVGVVAIVAPGAVAGFRLLSHPSVAVSATAPAEAFPVVSLGPEPGAAIGGSSPSASPSSFSYSVAPSASASASVSASPSASSPSPSRTVSPTPTRVAAAISDYSACSGRDVATFQATFRDVFDFYHVFIDTDGDASTGYRVPSGGIGADFMLENGALYESGGAAWSWKEVKNSRPATSHSGHAYRWQIRSLYGNGRVVFNGSGGDPEVYSPAVEVSACP
ncbi:hypothetical protein [Actinoplanes sp. NPDC051851]|uniref:hypothetical protein n=1 Tax=Actinoplanes sp. NPDC051851 TaxID=3154753 RepID=UPI003430F7EE